MEAGWEAGGAFPATKAEAAKGRLEGNEAWLIIDGKLGDGVIIAEEKPVPILGEEDTTVNVVVVVVQGSRP